MPETARKPRPPVPPAQIRQIQAAISALDWICPGTLLKRWKVCGRPNCRCAQDPQARHGPYYEWSRRERGHLRHSLLAPDQAQRLATAIANHAHVLGLLARWSQATAYALTHTHVCFAEEPTRLPRKRKRHD